MTKIQTVSSVAVVALGLALMVTSDFSTSHYLDCLPAHQCEPTKKQPDWRCCPEKYCCFQNMLNSRDYYSKCIPKDKYDSQYCDNFALGAEQLANKRHFEMPKTSMLYTLAAVTGDASYMNLTDVPSTQEFMKIMLKFATPKRGTAEGVLVPLLRNLW